MKKKPNTTADIPTMTAEQAQRILTVASQAKVKACQEDIDSVLKRHNCALDMTMTIGVQGVQPRIRIIPLAAQPPAE